MHECALLTSLNPKLRFLAPLSPESVNLKLFKHKYRFAGIRTCISMVTASSSLSTLAVWASLMLPVPMSPAAENLTPSLVHEITTDSPNWGFKRDKPFIDHSTINQQKSNLVELWTSKREINFLTEEHETIQWKKSFLEKNTSLVNNRNLFGRILWPNMRQATSHGPN